jgi:hypothetical protein
MSDVRDELGEVSPGLLRHLGDKLGEGVYDASADATTRFRTLIRSGAKVGQELRKAFERLHTRAHRGTQNVPEGSFFAGGAAGAGAKDGGTAVIAKPQQKITEELEARTNKDLVEYAKSECMQMRRGQRPPREVMAMMSVNEFSAQFVGAPATRGTYIDNSLYVECWSVYLGLESPCCRGNVGLEFRNVQGQVKQIDIYGDNLGGQRVVRNHCMERHDTIKWVLNTLASWAGQSVECEVFDIFAPWINEGHQQGNRFANAGRQGYVPDFLVRTGAQGFLADLKTFGVNKTRYPPRVFRGVNVLGAVRKRQETVHAECVAKLAKADLECNGHQGPGDGPAVTRLNSAYGKVRGWCVGGHGECSSELTKFVDLLAGKAGEKYEKRWSCKDMAEAVAFARQYILRRVGVEAVVGLARMRQRTLATILVGPETVRANQRTRTAGRRRYEFQADLYAERLAYSQGKL